MRVIVMYVMSLSLALSLCACGDKKQAEPQQEIPRWVKTTVVGEDESKLYRNYPGKVSASQKVALSFNIPGPLFELPITEGQEIRKGQLIARIDPKNYQIEVDRQKAKFDHAEITFRRYEQLLPTEAISQSQYDEKKALFQLEQAKLAAAQKDFDDTYLYAPFDGYISNRYVENFEYVQSKQPIVNLQNIQNIEIIIYIPEQDVARADDIERLAEEGKATTVGAASFPAIPGEQFPVTVKEVKTEADPETQTYKITLLMPAPEQRIILPGMTANVKMKFVSQDEDKFYVPITAITTDPQGQQNAWVIDMQDMRVKPIVVQVGEMRGDTIAVLSGLHRGETIITAGTTQLQDNMKVRIITGKIGKQ